jgi:hypothetical protein
MNMLLMFDGSVKAILPKVNASPQQQSIDPQHAYQLGVRVELEVASSNNIL